MRGFKTGISAILTAMLVAAFAAAPVAADRGYEDRVTGAYPPQPNPCTGGDFVLFFDLTYLVHEHRNNLVFTLLPHKSGPTGTSDGYVYVGGNETIVVNPGGISNPTVGLVRHPNGSLLQYLQMVNLNANGELVVLFAEWSCLRPPPAE